MTVEKKPLFVITKDQLETGLRGFPVGYCTTSTIDPNKGLFYKGISISQMAKSAPEEVIYLLMFGKKGGKEEVAAFFDDLKKRMTLKPQTIAAINSLPKEGSPLKLFAAVFLIVGMLEKVGDYREDCYNVIAKVPYLAALVINHHAGWGETPSPDPKLGYMENFVAMLQVPCSDKKKLTEALRLFNLVHYDHGGGNLSTFVGKAVASGLEDLYGSLASAMCALSGPLHGKANQDCLEFLKELLREVGGNSVESQVEKWVRDRLANKKIIFGFGHAVLRKEDPRARIIYEYLIKNYGSEPLVKIALQLRAVCPKVLAENPKIADPHPNIDAISGTLLAVAGFDYPQYFTILFGLSRVVGISRQIVYERLEARGGKGTPIVRPKYLYMGPELEL
jgi:citrate synthase